MNEGSSGEYVVKAIASATLDKTKIKPSNSKVRFFKKFVTLSKKFVFITNRLRTFYHFYESVKNCYMIKQRICIVGDGLSGLMTAVVLAKDLVSTFSIEIGLRSNCLNSILSNSFLAASPSFITFCL